MFKKKETFLVQYLSRGKNMESNKRVVSNILDYIDSNLMEDISIQDIAIKDFLKTGGY